jgi:dimethylargininase
MLLALTRPVPPSIVDCELTHLAREAIDVERATEQHRVYEEQLALLGFTIRHLPATPDMPDSVFVEDTAVVLDELAVITRPGAESRRGETETVALALAAYRTLHHIEQPGTLDGGDVLCIGKRIFVGRSERTNEDGIAQLRTHVKQFGYPVEAVGLHDCLHLKTAITAAGESTVVMNPNWIDVRPFESFERIDVDPGEPFAANVLLTPRGVLMSSAFPRTAERLRQRGIEVHTVDASELAKAEGGVTCCSLLLRHHHGG